MFNLKSYFEEADKDEQIRKISPRFLRDIPGIAREDTEKVDAYTGRESIVPQVEGAGVANTEVPRMANVGAPVQQETPAPAPAGGDLTIGTGLESSAPTVAPRTPTELEALLAKQREITGRDPDKKRKWPLLQRIGSVLMGGLTGFSQYGLGGAIVGAVKGGTDRNFVRNIRDQRALAQLRPRRPNCPASPA